MKRHRDDDNGSDDCNHHEKARAFVTSDTGDDNGNSSSNGHPSRAQVTLRCLTDAPALVREVKKLNLGVLPVQCPEFCYKRALRDDKQLSWAATLALGEQCGGSDIVTSKVLGALVAEYEALNKAVHVRTLAVEPQYRRQGVARQLIERLVQQAETLTQQHPVAITIERVQLHVHVGNTDGIAFYERMGFHEHARLERYYRHLEPPACLVMRYELVSRVQAAAVVSSDDDRSSDTQTAASADAAESES